MPTNVVMPQMGESVAEGTIVRWLKNVGDAVDRDEPLFEISTDKVDAEIPAPAAGVLTEVRHKEGETVPVNTVVAIIGQASEAAAAAPGQRPPAPPPSEQRPPASTAPTPQAPREAAPARPAPREAPTPRPADRAPSTAQPARSAPASFESLVRQRSSPLVRKIASEHGVDISRIPGTGIAGRVTKRDILEFIGQEGREGLEGRGGREGLEGQVGAAPGAEIVKMSVMRKKIAEHMVMSRRTSAHVHSVFEVNFSRVAQARAKKKDEFERAGIKLTYLSFILSGVVDALRAVPVVNASVDGDNIVYHKEINLGVAVALDRGLIVPVIRHADEKNLLGLSRAVSDLAARARAKQLKPDEVSGGTFTITNPGVFGALFGMPIINQPQVAILGVGNIEKRPVVVDDAIAIRPMAYLTLGYDHRLIDGAVADEFMSHLKQTLENWDSDG
jgi:2-oxoglutarate dehydrogenase E2 component (dihydrolipoamide succinyltransferase)